MLRAQSKGSCISLENEVYAKSNVVYEDGSDRQGNPPFTDDEPTAGVAEALTKQKEEEEKLKLNNQELVSASDGAEACVKDTARDECDEVPEFNSNIDYGSGTTRKCRYVKKWLMNNLMLLMILS